MAKLFLGGLSSSTTAEAAFARFGEVSDAIVMRERGFGFVTFASQEGADAALLEPKQEVDGSTVDVKQAVGKGGGRGEGGGGGGGGGGPGPVTDKIFVGGLPQDCSDDKIKEYFQQYGPIKDAVVMKDRDTNRSRGFGFVQFETPDPVDKVIADYSIHQVEGKWVEVKRSIPREQMPAGAPVSRGPRNGGCGGGGGGGGGGAPPPNNFPGYGPPAAAYGGYGGYGACGGCGGYGAAAAYGQGYPGYGGYGAYMSPPGAYGGYPMDPYGGYGYGAAQQGKGGGRSAPY